MSRIEKMLDDWVAKDLITHEQAKKISDYESSRPGNSWVLYDFLILGAVIIGIGVISLIAANWKNIPETVKLFVDFSLLVSLAVGAYRACDKKKPVLFEVLLVSFMLLCLASIGLISQIYHTGGQLYQALLMWSVMTTGVAAASRQFFAPFIWATGFLSGMAITAIESPAFQPIFQKHGSPVFMTLPLLSALLVILCKTIGGEGGQTKALRSCTIIGGLIALMAAETQLWRHNTTGLRMTAYLPGYLLAALCATGIWLSPGYKKPQKLLLLLSLGLYLIPFHFPMFRIKSELAYAAFTLTVLASMAIFLASLKIRWLFQLFLVALGLRFLILYFQALGGLASTGFGLIISGTMIIAMVVAWNKYRKRITNWAEDLIK